MATQMRVYDAVMIEQDEQGLFVDTSINAMGNTRQVRIVVPDRFFDIVQEARKMGKRIRVYYKTGAAEADLVEMV